MVSDEHLEALVGVSGPELASLKNVQVFCDLGEGPSPVGVAASVREALVLLFEHLFDGEVPAFEGDIVEGSLAASIPDPFWRAVAHSLSEDYGMGRTHDPDEVDYLRDVVDERPELRLVVAWEAVPPHQDAGFGLFVPR